MPSTSLNGRHRRVFRRRAGSACAAAGDVVACVDAVRRLVRALRVTAHETQRRVGVSAAQLFVLAQLAPERELSLSELASRTLTDRTSVAAVIERLVERGLVIRGWSSDDMRRAAVRITPAGRRLLRQAPRAPTTRLIGALESLPADRVTALASSLGALIAAMGLSAQPAPLLFDAPATTSSRRSRRA